MEDAAPLDERTADALAGYYDARRWDLRWEDASPAWARWSVESGPDGPAQTLRDYDAPGRGRFPVMRARVLAKHTDQHAWRERREGERYDHRLQRSVPRTPVEDRCPCTDWYGARCVCAGRCKCHWVLNPWPEVSGVQ